MAQIAFILLCHKDPEAIIQQARGLTAVGDCISIHFDARAAAADYERITSALKDNPRVVFARRRLKCGWGGWSLVAATLLAVEAAVEAFPRATHFYMVSGDCMAIKSAHYAHAFLDAEDADYIESVDYFESGWIKTGFREERLIYRHWFNERTQKRLFYASYDLQKRLGLTRRIPEDLQMMIGSQWWCLRRQTIEWVLDFCRQRPDVMRFFRTTWIPDETFFQTVVRHIIPGTEIRSRTPTFLLFTDYGMPVVFYDDHYDLLLSQDYLFARKISPGATELKRRLGALYASETRDFRISNEGRRLFHFLTGRGRTGRRFAPRFWETESTLGHERTLIILACKKWHVGKRVLRRLAGASGIAALEYLFDEEATPLPDLGGIQKTMEKRTRHRRALMRMLFDYHQTDRLMICLDPNNMDLLRDFQNDRSVTKVLEIDCVFSESYLAGHARRVGLAGETTPAETLATLLPTIRADIAFESDALRDAGFEHFLRLSESAPPKSNAAALTELLGISPDQALAIVSDPGLFSD
ncbi:DUF5928 domain-containing protein [Oceaniglobus roseus]|uniref:DUF5928 domain-containing protein n=1 Tax=Oceaniglobus roseus TaxID=1737570 RepID=UPI000C7F0A77|nr:DUF5928 domain-containing protein [Kandeliimicrobium roseum]